MVLFNHATREMTAKIVYYGPGLCGKTTNLMVIYDKLDPKSKGKMLSLATKTDRTLFFDLLPVDIGKVGNFNLKIQLYTVPGQVFYNETRKLVLKGADAVVFVADSQKSMVDSNKESFSNLLDNMRENQLEPDDTPIVVQYNKRDIPGVPSVDDLERLIGLEGYPHTAASAIKGDGVMETFKLVSKITAKHLFNRLKGGKGEPLKKAKIAKPAPEKPKSAGALEAPPLEAPPLDGPFGTSAPSLDPVPFPDAPVSPLDAGYEKMEEVSLEHLLQEGRERPATFSGTVPIPIESVDEVEELGAEEIVEEAPAAVAVMDEPKPKKAAAASGSASPGARVRELQHEIDSMREQHRSELESILRELEALTSRVRGQLG
ncbi:MAG TPA: GTPase domain-containing protein [Thermoanaerobaculia bacterium]|nr:GTPase domain-containing protein [Thermoanaerobaculia bacterium]